MDRFAPEVWRLQVSGNVVLYRDVTGRSVTLPPATVAELDEWALGLPPPPTLSERN